MKCSPLYPLLVLLFAATQSYPQEILLSLARGDATNIQARISSSPAPASVLQLESSGDLLLWNPLATTHDALLDFPDFQTAAARFYRVSASPRGTTNDWKNQVVFPDDPFRSPPAQQQVNWIKFLIPLATPTRVYYQESSTYPFHYDFAVARLPAFEGMDRATFDFVSLYRTNQQVVLGAILLPAEGSASEYGIQFVGLDPYTPDQIAAWFNVVKETVFAPGRAIPYYVATFEQSEMARTNLAAFEQRGIRVASLDRWITANHIYAAGWALGTLKFFPASEITAAFSDGRLAPADILLTDGVPAETPPVAGIISLRPSTPNSHTAILSRSFGIPFVYFPELVDQEQLQQLVGGKILLRAKASSYAPTVDYFDLQDTLTSEAEAQVMSLKAPPSLHYEAKQLYGAFSAATDALAPADIRFFGGKAANYGFLRRAVPAQSPPAIAFSFDLWDAFMSQTAPGSTRILREEIAARLASFTNYPPPIQPLQQTLAGIRILIRSATFTADQQNVITNSLKVFDASRKIRFRSSTNVEDGEFFTGAGLYDSYSGCLLDDLDGDTAGPSRCDPTENQERGVFRAILRVYASFYNDNAFLERLRYRVDETTVGMAVLVHHSFPDPDELANGVATLNFRSGQSWQQITGKMVTQRGAVSVTNPDGNSLPEVVEWERFSGKNYFYLSRYSSLLPLGAYVLDWEKDYNEFVNLFLRVTTAFRAHYPDRSSFALDFEYKKDRVLGLVVKQVREIPEPNSATAQVGYLLDAPETLVVAQKEAADVFSNHRLKSLWNVHTRNMWLSPSNHPGGIYTQGGFDYVNGTEIASLSGPLTSWPDASVSANGATNTWSTGSGASAMRWTLQTSFAPDLSPGSSPVFVSSDFPRVLTARFAEPQPVIEYQGPTTVTESTVVLEPALRLDSSSILVERNYSTNSVTITTSFYWPKPPGGVAAGYTAPLVRFIETRITGLTTTPMVLTNYFSQTYRPGHHNFSEEFVFEPRLEPGLPTDVRAQLEAANIHLIYLQLGGPDRALVLGYDRKFRNL